MRVLEGLGFDLDDAPVTDQTPAADARFEALVTLIDDLLIEPAQGRTERAADDRGSTAGSRAPGARQSGSGGSATGGSATGGRAFRLDERLIVFTEYKTTLDYLARRLRERYPADRVLTLFGSGGPGGMEQVDREHVKAAFNDPAAPVRVLVATDAASEGLNLHCTARYLLHLRLPLEPFAARTTQRTHRPLRAGP